MRKNDRAFAVALERGEDMQQEGVVAIFLRRDAEGEAVVKVVSRVEAIAPRLGREWRIVRHIFHEQQDEDVILVLRGVHATAQFIAALPKGRVKFGFFYRHKLPR